MAQSSAEDTVTKIKYTLLSDPEHATNYKIHPMISKLFLPTQQNTNTCVNRQGNFGGHFFFRKNASYEAENKAHESPILKNILCSKTRPHNCVKVISILF